MTDPHAPLSDEDLSAALDGQADASVLERLRTDPQAQERYRSLESARSFLETHAVPALSPDLVDTLVERAIAEGGAADAAPAAVGNVTPLTAPPRSAHRRTGPPMWSVAAVVAALVAVGIGLVWSGRDDGNGGDQAATPTTQLDPTDAGDRSAAEQPDGPDPTFRAEPGVPAIVIDLGRFDTKEELREALRDEGVSPSGTPVESDLAPTTEQVQRCGTQVATLMEGEGISDSYDKAYAQVADEAYLVYEFELDEPTDDATHLISVVDPVSCNPLITFYR